MTNTTTVRSQLLFGALLTVTFLVCAPEATAQSQSQYDKGTPPQFAAGVSSLGSYTSADLGTVNLSNGALNLKLPLGNVGGRGLSLPLTLNWSSKIWSASIDYDAERGCGRGGCDNPNPNMVPVAYADYANADSLVSYYQRIEAGWTIGGVPELIQRVVRINFTNIQPRGPCYDHTLPKLTLMMPDRGEVEFRDDAYDGAPLPSDCGGWVATASRGRHWHATDGSGLIYINDTDNGAAGRYPDLSGVVITGDGTRFYFGGGGGCYLITDRNGNKISISANGIVDPLGRTTTIQQGVPDPENPSETLAVLVTVTGYNALPRYYKVRSGIMNQHYRSDINPTLPVVTGSYDPMSWGYSNWWGPSATRLFPFSYGLYAQRIDDRPVISELILPDHRSLHFNYNEFGEVAEVQMPTGGKVWYDYGYVGSLPSGNSPVFETTGDYHTEVRDIDRALVERRTFPDGSTLEGTWNYGYGFSVTVTASAPDGTLMLNEAHFFLPAGRYTDYPQSITGGHDGTYYNLWSTGIEWRTETRNASGAVLAASEQDWTQRASVSWSTYTQEQPENDNRVNEARKILDDGSTAKVHTYYQPNVRWNNPSEIQEFDYDQSLKHRTTTTYADSNNAVNGFDYTSDPIHLLHLPLVTTVYDGNSNQVAQTVNEYDNYSDDTNHAPLADYGSVTQHDSNYGPSYLTRGDLTRAGRWLNLTNSFIYNYPRYDDLGNVVSAKDPNGNVANMSFADDFGDGSNPGAGAGGSYGPTYALPTLITSPPPNPGEPVQTARSQYDFSTGLLTGFKDRNGIITQTIYNDPFDRPTHVKSALGISGLESHAAMYYAPTTAFGVSLANNDVLTAKDQTNLNDAVLRSWTHTDGFGRTVETWSRDPQGDDKVATIYDALGRVSKQSNRFRPSLSETPVFSMTAYDLMGRVTTVTTPDNAVVTTAYSGNTVTVTDQSGKQRKSVSDALGRVVKVYEAPNDPGYNYLTSYSYDTLDDLTSVNQSSQTRTFIYDSLKRLTSATNSESGTVGYQYNDNGNPKVKTDARGISTHSSYDALNRVTRRWYNGSSSSDQLTNNVPALPSGVATSDEVAYLYDSQALPSSAPNYVRGYSNGRLVAVSYGTGSSVGDYYGYDAAGRDVLKIQQTGGLNYQVTAAYNLAGAPTGETYPSGHTVTYVYDNAERANSFTGNLGDGTNRGYATGITYTPFGGLAQEQFGTATPIYNKLFYNSRAQLSEIREGITPNDTNWERGAIINRYSLQAGCVGASCSATDNNGNLIRQDVYIPNTGLFSQFYAYDPLNRLQSVREDGPPGPTNWQQAYTYDQYGNRKIDSAATWGNGINNMQAAVDPNTTTNRMYAPGETDQNHSLVNYDSAGNQTKDYYSYSAYGMVYDRNYDAENRMKSSMATYSSPASTQTSTYTYDGGGRRVKRNIAGTETWQVYGLGGELLAEYAPNASYANPQKEYGYRNGQLLITATTPAGLAANTATDKNTNAVAAASPASGTESRTTTQSFDLLASIKGLMLRLPGINTDTSASTEAVSDTSTPLFGPSLPYASLNRSAIPLMPQSGSAQIAFASNRDGSAQIYSMNTDGSGLSRLTNDAANDEAPNWSPNNSRIVFQSDRGNLFSGIADIYVMNWDGSGQTRLTSDPADDSAPVWSPDGTKIAFQSARNGVSYQVYVMNADGSGQVNVSNSTANDTQPSWSSDGSKIAFASDRDQAGFSSIYVMNANGTNQTRLTISGTGLLDQQPAWSPDGTKLTFTSTRDSTVVTWTETDDNGGIVTKSKLLVNKEVYVMNANGSAQVRLTNTLENDDSASWSGDGTKIVFRSDRERGCCDPTEQVWVMNSDGTSQTDLSNNGLADHCPSWQHVLANMPPTVSLTSPTNGATFIAPANITITANASDSDGYVSRVDFYQGITLIGTATASPYTVSWNSVAAGTYSITARATDNLGATTTSAPVNIIVNAPPTVSITTPTNGASFTAPANITITANASDSDGSVSRVDFYQGITLIGTATTSPYTISWNNVAAGGYTLTARATDNLGASTTSNQVNITVGSPPTVSITSPANAANFTAPANMTITASASSSTGSISRVEFYQGTTLIGTSTASPYSTTWNNVAAGGYTLKARAIDNTGASTDSTPVNISVNAPPTVSVTSPTNGANFSAPANITISANASDSDGSISRVDFYQGTTLIGTATASPYNVSWNNVTAGSYALTTKATDNLGAQTNSTAVNITVITPVADIRWIVTDQLGTPRMIFDQTGSLANVSRHDYLPFGEELTAGGRTPALGYGAGDGARQKFTQKERDLETGLDYFLARYYSSMQGRFTSVDPQNIIFEKEQGRNADERVRILQSYLFQPQNWNKYTYTRNNPLAYTDPSGRCSAPSGLSKGNVGICIEAFIASPTFRSYGKGDNRDFAANDPSKTFRVQVSGVITRGNFDWSAHLEPVPGTSEPRIPILPGLRGTVTLDAASKSIDKDGNFHITLKITGLNGFSSATGIGDSEKIQINLKLIITQDGKVGVEKGSESTNYPSIALYSYNLGSDGKPMSNVIFEYRETKPSELSQPLVEIYPVNPSRCPQSPGCIK